MKINCSAIPDTLLEAELFGYEKGAFTDAKNTKKGLFELADGGTVFLDEIGDMKPLLQSKILRFLETQTFMRVGGEREIKVDVRIIAATNRDLETLVRGGVLSKGPLLPAQSHGGGNASSAGPTRGHPCSFQPFF